MEESQLEIDPIDDLMSRFDAFHIGTRWRVVGAPAIENGLETLSSDAAAEESEDEDSKDEDSEDEDSSSNDGEWEPRHTQLLSTLGGLLPTAMAIPHFVEYELEQLSAKQRDRNRVSFPKRINLPFPEPGCRPCWEPPIFEYSKYDDSIQAHHSITAREGRKDIEWRTEVLDITIESGLLHNYKVWVEERLEEAQDAFIKGESSFYTALLLQVEEDFNVVEVEADCREQKFGKRWFKNFSRKYIKEINAIRIARGASPASESETDSSSSASQAGQYSRSQSPEDGLDQHGIDGTDGTTAAVPLTHLGDLDSSNVVA